MKIKKDSHIYRYVYYLSDYPPKQANLCRFFWRFAGMTLLYPIFGALVVIAGFILVLARLFSRPIAGVKSEFHFKDPYKDLMEFQDTAPRVYGFPLRLGYLFGIVGIPLLVFLIWSSSDAELGAKVFLTILAAIGYGGLFLGIREDYSPAIKERVQESDFIRVVKEYVKAKKQKVCPIIEFTD